MLVHGGDFGQARGVDGAVQPDMFDVRIEIERRDCAPVDGREQQ